MKEAIINYINALADRNRPCVHDWELLMKREASLKMNPDYRWHKWTYRCKKCGDKNIIDEDDPFT